MRTVVSVSMDPEMATRLKSSAAEKGLSFSARVCELLESGEVHEVLVDRMGEGLFAQTEIQSDDDDSASLEVGEKSGAARGQSDTGSEPESSLPSDRPDVIESSNEDQLDSRRSEDSAQQGPEEVEADTSRKAVAAKIGRPPPSAPAGQCFPLDTGPEERDGGGDSSQSPPVEGEVQAEVQTEVQTEVQMGSVAERVYACVTAEKTSVKEIAERAGVSEVEAGEVLERLIDQDGEPIGLGRVGGEWVCWIQISHA